MYKLKSLQNSLKYQLLTEHSQEIILFFDQAGRIIEWNHAATNLLGYGDNICQIPITDIFRKAVKKVNGQLVIHIKFQNKMAETVAYCKNQTCINVNLRITIKQHRNKYLGACIAVDFSDKKVVMRELTNAKNELNLAKQTKNEFVANISHELRTPVNGIMGLIENLMETELNPKQLETVNIIHRCCINMNSNINNLLDYTKIANNKLILERREFDFRVFINNIIAFNINMINEKGLQLIVNIADDIPSYVIGDELRLTQILNNLFSNAIKFTAIGQIALEVVMTEQTENEIGLFFMIIDTGIGIGEEEKGKLFQSFSQVDGSITRKYGGTGLGLSISKLLVEAMNGTIAVESEKNSGSSFSFSIHLEYTKTNGMKEELEESIEGENRDFIINKETIDEREGELSSFPEIDYIGKILNDVNLSPLNKQGMGLQVNHRDSLENTKIAKDMLDTMERLMICIEMGRWIKAEYFAIGIKKRIPKDNKELSNKALRLVLSVRKEEHDTSLLILNELREMVKEVTEWNI